MFRLLFYLLQQFLSVPGSNSYLHMNKGMTLENSFQPSQGGPPVSQQQSQQSPQQTYINCHPHQYPQQQSPQSQWRFQSKCTMQPGTVHNEQQW
uniref:Uncharacterized protein n=1 Tax=Phlebotomus papatasi TaxID=29031 RepID=A0A1B0GQS2_PHLPP